MQDRPGHDIVPQLVTASRQPVRHVAVPRSVSMHVRDSASLRPHPSRYAKPGRQRACVRYNARRDHGIGATAGGGPFTRTPEAETYVVSPQQAPVPPRQQRPAV